MKSIATLILISALLFAGCVTTVVSTRNPSSAQYDKFQIVADDFANRASVSKLTTGAIPLSEASKRFSLFRGGPFYSFQEGKSYFRTIALPASSPGMLLEIRSYYSHDFPTTLFVPALLFLDSAGGTIEKRPTPPFKIVNGLGEHIRLAERIPAGASFAVIYTTPERVKERMIFMTYSMTGVVPTPSFATHDTGFGGHYEGFLKVSLGEKPN